VVIRTAADHAAFFPVDTGDVHGPASGQPLPDCFACHGETTGGTWILPASMKRYSCTHCHVTTKGGFDHASAAAVTSAHVGVTDFAAKVAASGIDGACYGCHKTGQAAGPVDHGKRFPLPHPGRTGAPSVAACADCHTVATTPQDVATLGCAGCHDARPTFAAAHAGVASFSDTGAACVRCHPAGEHLAISAHAPFLLAPTADVTAVKHLASALAGGDCFKCHPTQGTAETATAFAKPWAQDFTVIGCGGCHLPVGPAAPVTNHDLQAEVAAMHVATIHFATAGDFTTQVAAKGGWPNACYACHGDGTSVSLPPNHKSQLFPLPHPGASGAPSAATCADCHLDPLHREDVTKLGCAACHDARPTFAGAHTGVASFSDTAAGCVRCHPMGEHLAISTHTPFLLAPAAGAATVRHLASALAGGDCFQCHPTLGRPATTTPAMPAKAYAQLFTTTTCVACHATVGHATATTADHTVQAQLAALHVANGGVTATTDFDQAVTTAGSLSAACLRCHADGTGVALPSNHATQLFPLPHPGRTGAPSTAGCTDCHLDATHKKDVTTLGCASCHDARPTFAAAHAGVASFSDTPAACVRCHPMGEHLAIATHTPFLLAPTTAAPTVRHLASALTGGDCFQCHPTLGRPATTTPAMPAKAYAQLFTTTTCVACHVTVGHATTTTADHGVQAQLATLHVANGGVATVAEFNTAVTTAGSLSAACLQCHAGGTGDAAPADHAKWFPIGAGTKHVGIGCNACHTNPANRLDLTAFACASCHAKDTSPTLAVGHTVSGYAITSYQTATTAGGTRTTRTVDMTNSQNCLKCHGDGQVNTVASHPAGTNNDFGTGRHQTGGCFTCHFTLRSDKAYALSFSTPPQNVDSAGPPPVGCYVCHATGTGAGN
jgi:protein-arginine kinase activator protein McsA